MKSTLGSACLGCVAAVFVGVAVLPLQAETHGWAGDGTGYFSGAKPPMNFSETGRTVKDKAGKTTRVVSGTKGIAWKKDGLFFGKSQPVVAGNLVLTQIDPYVLVAFDKATGEEKWRADNSQETYLSGEQKELWVSLQAENRAATEALSSFIDKMKTLQRAIKAGPDAATVKGDTWKADFEGKRMPDGKERQMPSDAALAATWTELVAEKKAHKIIPQRGGNWAIDVEKTSFRPAMAYMFCDLVAEGNWRTEVGTTFATPCIEGDRIYVACGNNVVACYDTTGRKVWGVWDHKSREGAKTASIRRELEFCASPIIVGDLLVVAQDHERIRAYSKATGAKVWESKHAKRTRWMAGTPVAASIGGRALVISPSGHVYDAKDGKILSSDLPSVEGTVTPVVAGDMVCVRGETVGGKKGAVLGCYRLAATADGVTVTEVWRARIPGLGHRSPVVHNGFLYHIKGADKKAKTPPALLVYKVDDGTLAGDMPIEVKMGREPVLSLTDNALVISWMGGGFAFCSLEEKPKLLGQGQLYASNNYAPPCFAGDKIFYRGMDELYCIGSR